MEEETFNITRKEVDLIKKSRGEKKDVGKDNGKPIEKPKGNGEGEKNINNNRDMGKQSDNTDRTKTEKLEIEGNKTEVKEIPIEDNQIQCANCEKVFTIEGETPKNCPSCGVSWE